MTAATIDPDEPGAEVVPIRENVLDTDAVQHKADDKPEPEAALTRWQLAVQRFERPLPTPRQALASAQWWGVHGSIALRSFLLRLPWLMLRELVPIGRGLARVAKAWAGWLQCSQQAARIAADDAKGGAKAGEALERAKSGRRKLSAAVALLVTAGGWWFAEARPDLVVDVALLLGLLVLIVLDAVGRRAAPKTKTAQPLFALPSVLAEGVPLSKVTASILEAFEREGFVEDDLCTVRVAEPLSFDPDRREYRMKLQCPDAIETRHLRAIERAVGAGDHTARLLGTRSAAVRELVLRVGDPLANLVERPFVPTGSRSITQPVELGVSMTEVPFALPFAGVHMRVVMGTGGGKSKWFLRSAIDGVSACRDVVIGGIDITNGPELPLWRGVIQYRGLNVEDAEAVLDRAIAEIDRRGKILADIAEDDDPDNDVDEWHSGLGPAWVIVADEFAQLAVYDGKGGRPNLLGKCEQIVRTGRKHWVSLVMLTQRTGNDDFGSTTMSTQCGVSIAGPCDPADTVRMFGVERRDAGYTPHLLAPGVEGDIRDAGKVFIDSPMHRTPDIYRAFAPGTTAEVKRRARQRVADGLPRLDGRRRDAVDAVEVPEVLALLERAFAAHGDPEQLATADVLEFLGDGWTADGLARALREFEVRPSQHTRTKVRGYWLVDVQRAVRDL